MGKATIDATILAHRGWVSRFKTGFDGINTEYFELASTEDHNACDLGWWLNKDESRVLLGPDVHEHIRAIHARFHQICGLLASLLNQRMAGQQYKKQLHELDALSKEIVSILLHARDKQP